MRLHRVLAEYFLSDQAKFSGPGTAVVTTKLEKRVAGIEGMVANLIVDQQAMATSFNARGDNTAVVLTAIVQP